MPGIDIQTKKGDVSVGGNVAGRDLIDVVVNQYFTATQAAARPEARQRLRILVVAPDPLGQPLSPLSIAAEWAAFVTLVRRFNHPIAVVRLNPPTFTDLQAAVADHAHPFDVIHFIAHGDGKNLALEARDGTVDIQPYSKIAECLKRSPAQLVVLNVCQSRSLAELLSTATIAAEGDVPDLAAVAFAEGLYAGLFGRQPLAEALKMGERAMNREGIYTLCGDGAAPLARLDDVTNDLGPILFSGDPPHNAWLPGYSDKGFVGREEELLKEFFPFFSPGGDTAALLLTGIGGIGKTTLATAAARRYGWHFTGGVVSVSAKDVTGFGVSNVVSAIDAALGTEAGKTVDSVSTALNILNDGPHLLILDNLETMETREARRDLAHFVARLDAGSGARAILTMRPRALPEFSSVRHRELRVGPLPRAEAVKLLIDRAQDDGRKRMAGHEAEVADAAHYHPSLLTFAAGRLHLAPLNVVLNWLRDLRGDELDEEIPARLGAMIADVEQAAPGAAHLLCTLAVFSGGATTEAIETVYATSPSLPIPQSDGSLPLSGNLPTGEGAGMGVTTTLTELVKGNLAELDATDRYSLQSLVAQWARRHGPYTPEEWRAAGRKHAEYFLAFAQKHKQEYRALEPELENLQAAFAFVTAEATRDDELTALLVEAMDSLSITLKKGFDVALARSLAELAKHSHSEQLGDKAGLARTYDNTGLILMGRDSTAALDWFKKSVAIREELVLSLGGDTNAAHSMANTCMNIGLLYKNRGDYAAALEWCEKSLAIREALGDYRTGMTCNNIEMIGQIHKRRGDYAAALEWFEKAVAISEELGNPARLARNYNYIGEIHDALGDYAAALEWYMKDLAIRGELSDRAGLANSYKNIGVIHAISGSYEDALVWYKKSVAIDEELGNRAGLANSYKNIGLIYDARGNYPAAVEWLEKSLAICEEIGTAEGAVMIRGILEGVRERMTSPPAPRLTTKSKGVVRRGEPKAKKGRRKSTRRG